MYLYNIISLGDYKYPLIFQSYEKEWRDAVTTDNLVKTVTDLASAILSSFYDAFRSTVQVGIITKISNTFRRYESKIPIKTLTTYLFYTGDSVFIDPNFSELLKLALKLIALLEVQPPYM